MKIKFDVGDAGCQPVEPSQPENCEMYPGHGAACCCFMCVGKLRAELEAERQRVKSIRSGIAGTMGNRHCTNAVHDMLVDVLRADDALLAQAGKERDNARNPQG